MSLSSVGTKDHFLLDYNHLVVILCIPLLPRASQKDLINKFSTIELKKDHLKEWLDGQTMLEIKMNNDRNINTITSQPQEHAQHIRQG